MPDFLHAVIGMSVAFVTIDFWQTLYDSSNGAERNKARKDVLLKAVVAEHGAPDQEAFNAAYEGLWEYFDRHWLGSQRTPTSEEMVGEVLRRLDVVLPDGSVREVVEEFEEGILRHPPSLLPNVREGLEFLAAERKLALISDTAFSPGSILRTLMEQDGIARYFDTFIFSNETGFSKPHPEAFLRALDGIGGNPDRALHIGDIERTDIRGARGAGMRAVLYRSPDHQHKYAEEITEADGTMEDWQDIAEVLEAMA